MSFRPMTGMFLLLVILTPLVASSSVRELGELPTDRPLILAHRGSCGQLPEHSVESYKLAVEQGADLIECDIAVTKDLQLICSHEPWLNHTTDVHTRPEFDDRVKTYLIPSRGGFFTDYFTIDFTLEELKTLGKIQQRTYRDQNYNGKLAMVTVEEAIQIVQNTSNPKTVGIYPEIKIPEFFNDFLEPNGTTVEDLVLDVLGKHGYVDKTSPAFIQSFDLRSLQYLANRTDLRLSFLTNTAIPDGQLESMALYLSGVGPSKAAIAVVDPRTNTIAQTTDFIERAHKYGLTVHVYTFRNEYDFLAYDYGADPYKEYELFLNLGADGLFTDFPATMTNYMDLTTVVEKECPTDGAPQLKGNLAVLLTVALMGMWHALF